MACGSWRVTGQGHPSTPYVDPYTFEVIGVNGTETVDSSIDDIAKRGVLRCHVVQVHLLLQPGLSIGMRLGGEFLVDAPPRHMILDTQPSSLPSAVLCWPLGGWSVNLKAIRAALGGPFESSRAQGLLDVVPKYQTWAHQGEVA